MIGVTNGKLQKARTVEDIKTDSEFDMNEAQPQAKAQSTKTAPIVQAVGARNITVWICASILMSLRSDGGA
jgi:hypothetical protein